jgi:MYXO-CTERM domain-containing protein
MSKLKVLLALVASFSLFFLFSREAQATHFRYGNITYTVPDPINAPKTVRFDVITAWRADFVGSTTLVFGDGQQNPDTTGDTIGNGVDASGLPYKVQRYSVTHTYPAKSSYTAYFTSCCRISSLTDAGQHDQSFRIEAIVDLSTGNTGNAVGALPPIFQLQTGGLRTVPIFAIDPDGVPVHCRFGTPAETATNTMPAPIPGGPVPQLVDTPTGCNLTWDTTLGQTNQQYALNVVIESFNGLAKSDAMLDFIIELTAAPPPTCMGGGIFNVDLGTQFQQMVTGTDAGGAMLKMTNIGTFGSISPPPGTTQASPFNVTYTVSPSLGDQGVQIQTVVFANPQHLSGFCTLGVKIPDCPAFGNPCMTGVGACQANGFQYCNNGSVLCSAVAGQPQPEKCDNIDNNCDGQVDEGSPESGQPCTSKLPGLCAPGISECKAGGVLACNPNVQPGTVAETCDGVDQDCDGVIDNGFGIGDKCSKGDGQCIAAGKIICDGNGGTMCDAMPGPPTPEVCDGKDNNCNNEIDEGFGVGDACTNGVGACEKSGKKVCDANGGVTCDAVPGMPSKEICGNAVDEDCDGALNNGCKDTDDDGLYDEQEIAAGLDPNDGDSDDDGVLDGDEPDWDKDTDGDGLINALDPDSDNDGLFDGTELGLACDKPATNKALKNCVADADPATKTDPLSADTDKGGATDGSEDWNLDGKVDAGEGNPSSAGDDDMIADADGDGLGDKLETETLHTKANDKDTDDDGLLDGLEANPSCDTDHDGLINPLDVDSDNDALFDGTEKGKDCNDPDTGPSKKHCHFDGDPSTTTGVLVRDTDRGGVMDGSEDYNLNGVRGPKETDPLESKDDGMVMDSDGDGLSDELEAHLGSNPKDKDSDDDGVLDGDEPNPSDDADGDGQINLVDPDSDGDGLFDGTELGLGCDNADTDKSQKHCTADGDMGKTKTNPLLADSDGGGAKDGEEDANHNGVVDTGETDPNNKADDIKPECMVDSDCKDVGKVCDKQACVSGCRGTGASCPNGETCSSTDDTIGQCMGGTGGAGGSTGTGTGGDQVLPGGGCGCRTSGDDGGAGALGLLAFAGLAAAAARRRRKA